VAGVGCTPGSGTNTADRRGRARRHRGRSGGFLGRGGTRAPGPLLPPAVILVAGLVLGFEAALDDTAAVGRGRAGGAASGHKAPEAAPPVLCPLGGYTAPLVEARC